MQPIGILMKEHRIIERMLVRVEEAYNIAKLTGNISTDFLMTEIDFFQTFADKNHHAKEEDILFRALGQKRMQIEHRRIMSTLLEDHKITRSIVRALGAAREKYLRGSKGAMVELLAAMERLLAIYPKHIETEDKHFFYPSMEYFNEMEKEEMLEQFSEYNKSIDYEKYVQIAEHLQYPIAIHNMSDR